MPYPYLCNVGVVCVGWGFKLNLCNFVETKRTNWTLFVLYFDRFTKIIVPCSSNRVIIIVIQRYIMYWHIPPIFRCTLILFMYLKLYLRNAIIIIEFLLPKSIRLLCINPMFLKNQPTMIFLVFLKQMLGSFVRFLLNIM